MFFFGGGKSMWDDIARGEEGKGERNGETVSPTLVNLKASPVTYLCSPLLKQASKTIWPFRPF